MFRVRLQSCKWNVIMMKWRFAHVLVHIMCPMLKRVVDLSINSPDNTLGFQLLTCEDLLRAYLWVLDCCITMGSGK